MNANRKICVTSVFVDPLEGSPLPCFVCVVTHLPGMDPLSHTRQAFGTLARYQALAASRVVPDTPRVFITVGPHGQVTFG